MRLLLLLTVGIGWVAGCDQKQANPPAHSDEHGEHNHAGICEKHHLPLSQCPFCDKSLVEKWGTCVEHQVPEAFCWKCNSKLIEAFKAEGDWCAGHDMPESRCVKCNPSLLGPDGSSVMGEADRDESWAARDESLRGSSQKKSSDVQNVLSVELMADVPRSQRPPNVQCTTQQQRVRLASAEVASKVGLEYDIIQKVSVTQSLTCNAQIVYNQNRYARLVPRVVGTIDEVMVDLGQRVNPDQPLLKIDSAEFTAAQADYLQALATMNLWERNHAQEHALVEKGISSPRDDLEAETRLTESRIALSRAGQRLKSLDVADSQIEQLAKSEITHSQYVVSSPLAGVVVERQAVVGEIAETNKSLLAIADTSSMWALLDIYEKDVPDVAVGQSVLVTLDGLRGETFSGTIVWVSTQIDPQTRTLKVRAEFNNTGSHFRANMFGQARIIVHDNQPLLVVPKSAVQWDGCCNIVFVKQNEDLYEPRKVRLGYETDDHFVVREGLSAGEIVVTQGSFLLKTEIMKSSIGTGCCETGGRKE